MSQNNSNSNGMIWLVCGVIFVLSLLSSMFAKNGPDSAPTGYTPDRNSFEHRYATERFRQEGYSRSEAQQAADAVYKFHQAQQARQR